MVERTYGRFPYYQDLNATAESRSVTGASLRQSLLQPQAHAVALAELAAVMAEDSARAARVRAEVDHLGAPVELDAVSVRRLAAHGAYAAGVVLDFADSVDAFDCAVNEVNLDFQRTANARIGESQSRAGFDAEGQPRPIDRAGIRDTVERELNPAWKRANGALDQAADLAVARLRDGVRPADAKELIRAGHIPISVATCFDDLDLTDEDLAAASEAVVPEVSFEDLLELLGLWATEAGTAPERSTFVAEDGGDAAPSTWLRRDDDDPWAPGLRSTSGLSDQELWGETDEPAEGPSWSGADAWGIRSQVVLAGLGAAWRELNGTELVPTPLGERGADAWRGGAVGRAERPGVGSSLGGLLGGVVGRRGGTFGGPETEEEINERLSGSDGPG